MRTCRCIPTCKRGMTHDPDDVEVVRLAQRRGIWTNSSGARTLTSGDFEDRTTWDGRKNALVIECITEGLGKAREATRLGASQRPIRTRKVYMA